jgi:hypothetical protein
MKPSKSHRLRHVFQYDDLWWRFYQKHQADLRPVEVDSIIKMLACGTPDMGGRTYRCSCPDCPHVKHIAFSCKSRSCPSCGNKATAQWVNFQLGVLPQTRWQHITFTIPCEFWPLFQANRWMLGALSKLAADVCLTRCRQYGLTPGIFTALHTHGRALGWHPHIHLSITLGGITDDGQWEDLSLGKRSLESGWRYRIIRFLRQQYGNYHFPPALQSSGQTHKRWNKYLNLQYQRFWHVYLVKPTDNAAHTVNYLSRYLKRPVVSYSRLQHYSRQEIIYSYNSHMTHKREILRLPGEEFVRRFLMHIPDKYFRVIRYYGFLANRVRKQWLPKVYQAIQKTPKQTIQPVTHASLLQRFVNVDPLQCLLCKSPLLLQSFHYGLNLAGLRQHHAQLATMRPCRLP